MSVTLKTLASLALWCIHSHWLGINAQLTDILSVLVAAILLRSDYREKLTFEIDEASYDEVTFDEVPFDEVPFDEVPFDEIPNDEVLTFTVQTAIPCADVKPRIATSVVCLHMPTPV